MQPLISSCLKKRRVKAGSIYIDVICACFVLSLAAAAFYGIYPKIGKVQDLGIQKAKAMQICNRMVDQLQLMRATDVTTNTLTTMNLIDPNQTSSPYTFTQCPLDDTTDYSPRKCFKNGTGTLTVTPIDSNSVRCRVRVNWTSESGKAESYTTGTVIGGYR